MRTRTTRLIWRIVMICAGWQLLQGGCLGDIQREMEVLFATEASPALLHDSAIVDRFGLEFLKFFVDFW